MEVDQLSKCKTRVHNLANYLQVVIGHLELDEPTKALEMAIEMSRDLKSFAGELAQNIIKESPREPDQRASA